MKVAKYYNNHDIRIEELPKPKIENGEILVEVRASGICGTDVMEWYRIKKAPRILGHEISGVIVESKSGKYKAGERVFVSHHVPCNNCKYCDSGNHTACQTLHNGNFYPGGYSEYVKVPKINVETGVYVLPESVSFEEATMIEPLACVVRGQRITGVSFGQVVLILGCGVSGLLNIQIAKLRGAKKVIACDFNPYRLNIASEFGADEVIDAGSDFDIKADRVIVCAGSMGATQKAFESIDRKGVILLFAIPDKDIIIPTVDFWRNEITVTSSYGAAPVDLQESLEIIRDKRVDVSRTITHVLPLKDIQEAFDIVSRAEESLKVVLRPFA